MLGKADLSPYAMDVQLYTIREKHTERYEATVTLDFAELKSFYHANLGDPLIIDDARNKTRVFAGVVVESYSIDSKMYVLRCKGAAQHLEELTISNSAFINFPPQEIVYYLAKQTLEIDASERSIHGLVLDRTERDFLVAFPVRGVSVSDPVSFSSVTFCRLGADFEDSDLMIEKSGGDWRRGTVIAYSKVRSCDFIEAWESGREVVLGAIDVLSFKTRLSVIGYPADNQYQALEYQRPTIFSRISLAEQTYLRDLSIDPPKIWLRSELLRESQLELENKSSRAYSHTLDSPEDISGSLAIALRWLRIGSQENDLTDRLVDYWIALEFLVANEEVVTLLSQSGLDDLDRAIGVADITSKDEDSMTPEEKDQLCARVRSRINQVDLRERFDSFCKRGNVRITGDECECVWGRQGLRQQRNDLEHGRSVHVDREALHTMEHVLSKMVLAGSSANLLGPRSGL